MAAVSVVHTVYARRGYIMYQTDPNSGLAVPYDLTTAIKRRSVLAAVELPNGNQEEVVIPWWVISPEQEEAKKNLLESQFFLLRQGSIGEVLKCSRCGSKHRYFTLMCIERPFDGIHEGLHAYWYHAGRHGAENFLTEVELQRYEAIERVLNKTGTPDLASRHPETAKQLQTQENDFDAGTVALGLLEPITMEKARALAWNINAHGLKPPLRLRGLEQAHATV